VHGLRPTSNFSAPTVSRPTGLYANPKDLQILRTIFKWKVLPPSTLRYLLAQNENPKTFEKRLERLVHRKLLQKVEHVGVLRMLQLSEAGFLRFKNGVDYLKEDGFASEAIWHDFVTVALQLGIWAAAKPSCVDLVSEQELRRFYMQELPHWIPSCDIHRPDGFSRFKLPNGIRLVAYEVEISRKSADRYDSAAQFYATSSQVDSVIWLVKDEALMKTIQSKVQLNDSSMMDMHNFILFKTFQDKFWDAEFIDGQKRGQKLVEVMSEMSQAPVEHLSSVCRETLVSDFLKKLASN